MHPGRFHVWARLCLLLGLCLTTSCGGCGRGTSTPALPSAPRVYVSNEESNDISVIDPATDQVVATVFVGKRPRGIRLSPDGQTLYVAVSGSPRAPPGVDESTLPPPDRSADGIALVDIASLKLVKTLESGDDPEAFDITPDGRFLYVSNEDAAQASIVDLASGQVTHTVKVGGEPEGVTTRPDGQVVYVTSEEDHQVYAIDTRSHEVVARIPTGDRPRSVTFTPDGARAFITAEFGRTVTVVDAQRHQVLSTLPIERPSARPMGTALSPDGRTLYVTHGRGKSVSFIDVARLEVVHTVEDVGTRPWGAGVSPDGRKLYTANGPSNDVSVIDTGTGQVLKRIAVGSSPWGIAVSHVTGHASRP
ncbi:beta-propeller fold lactonase family protein [Stigmatella hybrida]|uniref:beta-propeller fold lactonase family protein n=1 Tax=Stigmatella hybrida TaxID=394097 RepID=UPI001CDB3E07|nr:beta-propeller fold lactonase family protein [Stigmatella hybrida]